MNRSSFPLIAALLALLLSLASGRQSSGAAARRSGRHGEVTDAATTWAVLVAGSSGYENYRHQADVCHAYQVLKSGGLKDENIVVFMYDDIAHNKMNPRKGVIINHPQGRDVYAGVPKDYTGEQVNPSNLYAVILGNKTAVSGGSGKVIDSKPGDRIFIYYTDHGSPGLLGMPGGLNAYAHDFVNVLKKKHSMGSYKEMVIYVEACESGSIFQGLLPQGMGIYVMTASNAVESSYGVYCPGSVPEPPPGFDTCLGDLFSVAWMEDSDVVDRKAVNLFQQYLKVRTRTSNNGTYDSGSHVMQYGEKSIGEELLYLYQGFRTKPLDVVTYAPEQSKPVGVVNQRDAGLLSLQHQYRNAKEGSKEKEEIRKALAAKIAHRLHVDKSVENIGNILFGKDAAQILNAIRPPNQPLVDNWDCLKSTVEVFEEACGSLGQYGMKHSRAFANMCNKGIPMDAIKKASAKACTNFIKP
ncbi:Vacuolar-processing enzyme [Nymphaea thermarum]|nr:Vacuolar-processing enzyme [Nymphaea thermarum]